MAIYLDNAATTFPKPPSVAAAVTRTLTDAAGNPGRGAHRLSLDAGRILFETREAVSEMFGVGDPARVVFTANATMALNLALFGFLAPGDRVVTTSMEHNAVTRPLRALAETGVQVVKVAGDALGSVNPQLLMEACRAERTRMLVLSHCSNVSGTLQAIDELGPWCRREGILLLVDAAQSAGLFPLHLEAGAIDLLAAPGHKGLYGPQGTGFLCLAQGLVPRPLIYGGTGGNSHSELPPEQLPERLEAGTPNTPGLAGLKAGIDFIRSVGMTKIRAREAQLNGQLLEGLQAIPGISLFGPRDPEQRGGAVSFLLAGRDPAEIGFLLDRDHGILTRVGLHCAPDAHQTLGTFPRGTIRVSPGYFNTSDDIEQLLAALAFLANQPAD
ncbi:aminotransferase class V-fold PLP-dependent enzyme [Desulfuromonas carbonis]|uniref:aminotransferase class V-fold PLP-dependent enzyme n=1 Tax=Desulfuromonas sp. DDH964 TaxID=1823759 RepID=UPI00078C367A|nr:aminotransferase class V-fold PLP-dependent enzyme [Desulfuromonas sp. DDH964]AMV72401.1 cysteine desulfurase [Desulfuromonas sp. DDH964]